MIQKPYRIAYLIDDLHHGGAQNLLALLVENLPEPYIPSVYCLSESAHPFGQSLKQKGIEVYIFKRRSHFDFTRLFSVTRSLASAKTDVIHGFLDASNAYAYLAGRILRKPTVFTLLSNRFTFGGLRESLIRSMYRRSSKILVNSKAGEAFLLKSVGVTRERIHLIRNWFPADRFPLMNPEPETSHGTRNEEVIGYLGRFSKEKGLDLLIRAFADVNKKRPGTRLVVIGRGEELEPLKALSRQLSLDERISFPGPAENALNALRTFSCFVLPSVNEGLPNVILEALAVGIPVVASAVGDVADLLVDGRTGVLIDHPSPQAFSDGIIKVLSTPSIAEAARREGPLFVKNNFSMKAGLQKVLLMYEELLAPQASL